MKTTTQTSSARFATVCASMVLGMASVLSFTLPTPALAQEKPRSDSFEVPAVAPEISNAFVPDSSIERPEDVGVRAHTNYVLFSSNGAKPAATASPAISPLYQNEPETPASLGCVYKVGPIYTGCDPATGGTRHPVGGWGAIAIVDAYDNPYAATDIANFSAYWGLPAANFQKVLATHGGCTVTGNTGWGLEEALDIEWAHTMAPSAKIYLVEACSSSYSDLMYAEELAGSLVNSFGGGDVSNSWGGSEWSTEGSYDPDFYLYWNQIAYFASAGDVGGKVNYPSTSPWVVSAGGTTVNRTSGAFTNESCWSGSGGGPSLYENMQGSQAAVSTGKRWTPDLAFDADPNSGVWVYDYYNGGWYVVGGTSVASPSLAGIVNNANNRLGQGLPYTVPYVNQEDLLLYSSLGATTIFNTSFYDVTTGSNGYAAGAGYDFCTGIGTPRGLLNK